MPVMRTNVRHRDEQFLVLAGAARNPALRAFSHTSEWPEVHRRMTRALIRQPPWQATDDTVQGAASPGGPPGEGRGTRERARRLRVAVAKIGAKPGTPPDGIFPERPAPSLR